MYEIVQSVWLEIIYIYTRVLVHGTRLTLCTHGDDLSIHVLQLIVAMLKNIWERIVIYIRFRDMFSSYIHMDFCLIFYTFMIIREIKIYII